MVRYSERLRGMKMKLSAETKADFFAWAKRVCLPAGLDDDGELLRPEWWEQALEESLNGPCPGLFELGKFDSRTGNPVTFSYDWEE